MLVVRAEHRSNIPGIVHGASTSGASLFLEPLSTVEINNDIVALEEQEAEEVRRILLALSDGFRSRAAELSRTIDAAAELDVLQARARFSQSIDGVEPALTTDGTFELLAARHPLLKSPVPVTIRILPPATILLVTGPNTGGKTVAIKTAGLLALMAQAGLRIPAADGSRLPVFRSVFADIGDEQSIDASLSTFSGHISNIASMDRALHRAGAGAAGRGRIRAPIRSRAARSASPSWITSGGGAPRSSRRAITTRSRPTRRRRRASRSAAFGFDAETFAPTYQLIYGSPGRSLAIEIAARLGLNPSIVAAARGNLSEREKPARRAPRQDRPRLALARARAATRRAATRDAGRSRRADASARGSAQSSVRRRSGAGCTTSSRRRCATRAARSTR